MQYILLLVLHCDTICTWNVTLNLVLPLRIRIVFQIYSHNEYAYIVYYCTLLFNHHNTYAYKHIKIVIVSNNYIFVIHACYGILFIYTWYAMYIYVLYSIYNIAYTFWLCAMETQFSTWKVRYVDLYIVYMCNIIFTYILEVHSVISLCILIHIALCVWITNVTLIYT